MSQNNYAAMLREMAERHKKLATVFRLGEPEQSIKHEAFAEALLAGVTALEALAQMRRFAEAIADDSSPILTGFAYQIQMILDKKTTEEPNEKD